MMKRALVLIAMVGLGFLFAWGASDDTSQQKAELENLKTELQQLKPNIEKAQNEKSALEIEIAVEQQNRELLQQKLDELTSSRVALQKQVEKLAFTCEQSRQQLEEIIKTRDNLKQRITALTDSRDELQQQLTELTTSRNQLKRQADELSRSRDEAAAKAQAAQDRVDILMAMIDAKTERTGQPQQQNEINPPGRIKVTEQAKEQTPPVLKVSEDPNVLTVIDWPSDVAKQTGERPVCHSFSTSCPQIMPGQTSILSWQVSNAESIRIEPGIGRVSALGSRAIKPAATTQYTLVAGNKEGQSRLSCRIEVSDRITVFTNNSIHPQVLLEEYKTSEEGKVSPGQKSQASDPNSTLGKFLGYRARQDESGKFVFVPVFENKQEEK